MITREDHKALSMATPEQKALAQLLLKGEKSIIDCYIEAYKPNEEDLKDREKIGNRAYAAARTKGVAAHLKKLQEQEAVEEARMLVWDKRRAAKRLLEMCHEIEVNVKLTRELRDKILNDRQLHDVAKLNQMVKVAQICNDTSRTIKECIQEMNGMYGLTRPEVSLTNAVQIIIGGDKDLPEDTVD